MLRGRAVTLRTASAADVQRLAAIRATPEVRARWAGDDLDRRDRSSRSTTPTSHYLAIELDGVVVGAIQWSEEDDPMYRHAGIDIFVDPSVHGRGVGADAVRTLCTHLIDDVGHHRLVIDPAADNVAAIRCYAKVGFRPVGVHAPVRAGPRRRRGTTGC